MTPIQVLERSGSVLSAVEIARLAGIEHEQCYAELNAAEVRGLVRILPINGKRSIMGWAAVRVSTDAPQS